MQRNEWFFRPITAAENPQIASIIRTVMTEFGTVGPGYSINDPEVDHIFESYQNDRSAYFVLEGVGKVLGGGGIGPLEGADDSVCELKKMYFLPEARGKGYGREIIQLLIDTAREIGYQQCYLETVERMAAANSLYQKMGFERRSCPMGNTGHSSCETYYVKKL